MPLLALRAAMVAIQFSIVVQHAIRTCHCVFPHQHALLTTNRALDMIGHFFYAPTVKKRKKEKKTSENGWFW
jgi:hypothetical protein